MNQMNREELENLEQQRRDDNKRTQTSARRGRGKSTRRRSELEAEANVPAH